MSYRYSKETRSKYKGWSVVMPRRMHKVYKAYCLERDTTMCNHVISLIEKTLVEEYGEIDLDSEVKQIKLRKSSKPSKSDKPDRSLLTQIPDDLYMRFKILCMNLDLPMKYFISFLLEKECEKSEYKAFMKKHIENNESKSGKKPGKS